MWKLLVTNNIKSGYNCDCVSTPNVGHILFEWKERWQNVVREMPMGMINSVKTTGRLFIEVFLEAPPQTHFCFHLFIEY